MKVSEEILALEIMAVNPVGYLVAPRFLALLVYAALSHGVCGRHGPHRRILSAPRYGASVRRNTSIRRWPGSVYRILAGLLKSSVFAVIIGMVGCYRALVVEGGAEG